MQFHGELLPITAEYANYPVPIRRINPLTEVESAEAYALLKDSKNIEDYGESDRDYPGAVCYYRPHFLAKYVTKVMSHIRPYLDYDILDTYYYSRLYGKGNSLDLHTDRGAGFIGVSLCLGYDFNTVFTDGSSWPIGTLEEDGKGGEREVLFHLKPGQGILYPGCSMPHWRDSFLGEHCGQAFFHYVPAVMKTFGKFFGDVDRGA